MLKGTLVVQLLGFVSIISSSPIHSSEQDTRVIDPPIKTYGSHKPVYNLKEELAQGSADGRCPGLHLVVPFNGRLGAVPPSVEELDTLSARNICPTASDSSEA